MNYKVVRTETADARIRKIILYVAENFGMEVALEKLEELEVSAKMCRTSLSGA